MLLVPIWTSIFTWQFGRIPRTNLDVFFVPIWSIIFERQFGRNSSQLGLIPFPYLGRISLLFRADLLSHLRSNLFNSLPLALLLWVLVLT
jgi:hypothetical protein